jgi:uncharacterized protein
MTRRLAERACPRCGVALVERPHHARWRDVRTDDCPRCGGAFLDRHELARLSGQRAAEHLLALDPRASVSPPSTAACPGCGDAMEGRTIADGHATADLDLCPTCHGVWLDAGELDAVAGLDRAALDARWATLRRQLIVEAATDPEVFSAVLAAGLALALGAGGRRGGGGLPSLGAAGAFGGGRSGGGGASGRL